MKRNYFPHYKQLDRKDCGPTRLKLPSITVKTINIQGIRSFSENICKGSAILQIPLILTTQFQLKITPNSVACRLG